MTDPVDQPLTPGEDPVPARLSYSSPPALMTGVVLSMVLLFGALYGWYALGPEIRGQVTWAQAGTLLFIVFLMIAIMLSVGYSRLWAADGVVTVRNGPFLRRYGVDTIAGVRLRPGDAWSSLLVKQEDTLKRRPVLAIQFLEGEGGKRKIIELRRWLKANGATSAGYSSADAD
ncbi:hypothetical protein H5392_10530 [Tessaracoccus sp. MC1865]|uniref:hypothetical protein n=1 Tax=Tessaracoccus sp. MC1865 TaxID=2760310 RepID=UPI001600C5F3|nr:hypothetical protein [Tessaracoccus sp. MC1865]MBB1484293.1 hypothetical protein [Tessaracoccus sp. MC1865]QTO38589.1 hypothetical protein J7D54_05785 [Tessaracoccus sp. MC1865]